MEVYVAKRDYEKEREDLLSFKEGDKFRIASKADRKWWSAYAVESGDYGYVPSEYLEAFVDPVEGELAQKLSESTVGDRKKVALDELKRRVPQTPASASSVNEDGEDSDSSVNSGDRQPNGSMIIKPLSAVSQPPEDSQQIEPKRLHNPVMASKVHMQMHKELKLNHSRGGVKNLGKPELMKVMQRRKADADGKPGPIKANKPTTAKSNCEGELAAQLAKRTQIINDAEKEDTVEQNKPEFLKVSLKKTAQSQAC